MDLINVNNVYKCSKDGVFLKLKYIVLNNKDKLPLITYIIVLL